VCACQPPSVSCSVVLYVEHGHHDARSFRQVSRSVAIFDCDRGESFLLASGKPRPLSARFVTQVPNQVIARLPILDCRGDSRMQSRERDVQRILALPHGRRGSIVFCARLSAAFPDHICETRRQLLLQVSTLLC